jgi:hypothetical protein
MANKQIELWEGKTVEVNEQLLDDADFMFDLNDASNNNDARTLATMCIALIGGDDIYQEIREHIEKEHGHYSFKELNKILEKVVDVLPKGGNRAQRRSWKTSN